MSAQQLETKTQHTICGALPGRGPAFGRKVAGCPRCDELLAGAAPVRWNTEATRQREADEVRRAWLGAATDRAYAAAKAQLDTCCQNKVWTYTISTGMIREVGVKDCPRHGARQVAIRPVPSLIGA